MFPTRSYPSAGIKGYPWVSPRIFEERALRIQCSPQLFVSLWPKSSRGWQLVKSKCWSLVCRAECQIVNWTSSCWTTQVVILKACLGKSQSNVKWVLHIVCIRLESNHRVNIASFHYVFTLSISKSIIGITTLIPNKTTSATPPSLPSPCSFLITSSVPEAMMFESIESTVEISA